eukprot:1768081-Pleurochrysis_carterae.AAC.1
MRSRTGSESPTPPPFTHNQRAIALHPPLLFGSCPASPTKFLRVLALQPPMLGKFSKKADKALSLPPRQTQSAVQTASKTDSRPTSYLPTVHITIITTAIKLTAPSYKSEQPRASR